jgi:hypothetical protein
MTYKRKFYYILGVNVIRPELRQEIAARFPDPHAAIDDLLDAWLPRLIASNEILTAALVRSRDRLAGTSSIAADQMLEEIEVALRRAAAAWKGSAQGVTPGGRI